MNSSHPSIEHLYIDGQKVLFPDLQGWQFLRLNPYIDEMPLAVPNLLWPTLEFTQKYPELYLGLGHPSRTWKIWMPYTFLEIESHFQRVHLETLKCEFCSWQGKTANPMVQDPYIGDGISQEPFELMRVAEKYSILPCPNCGKRLPRHPIWLEYPV